MTTSTLKFYLIWISYIKLIWLNSPLILDFQIPLMNSSIYITFSNYVLSNLGYV